MHPYDHKILDRQAAAHKVEAWKAEGLQVVFTNGCFDILHVGHLQTLSQARAQGDRLVVGLNSDASVSRLKGAGRPINSERDRASLLCGLECVDAVTIFPEDTPVEVISALRPDVHVKGGDYREEDLPEAPVVRAYGGRIVLISLMPERSTTAIIEKSRQR
jgi:rfaE bifunctional protein nucleotidyltransferase chain/domain